MQMRGSKAHGSAKTENVLALQVSAPVKRNEQALKVRDNVCLRRSHLSNMVGWPVTSPSQTS